MKMSFMLCLITSNLGKRGYRGKGLRVSSASKSSLPIQSRNLIVLGQWCHLVVIGRKCQQLAASLGYPLSPHTQQTGYVLCSFSFFSLKSVMTLVVNSKLSNNFLNVQNSVRKSNML